MSKKKSKVEVVEEVNDTDNSCIRIDPLTNYNIVLNCKYNDYKAGTKLTAIILPIRTEGTKDDWVDFWFVYDGDKLVGRLARHNDVITVTSLKKKGK